MRGFVSAARAEAGLRRATTTIAITTTTTSLAISKMAPWLAMVATVMKVGCPSHSHRRD
jgi:hypothetical protein